ncbi:Alkaline ceramidase 3 [Rhizophlyctis rosea]|uniref:Alkaline ceramidase 3 n=1 Tax=Rhizophlyctis rosea TaxID=64517 RepID=A0AAD5SAB6_9FUNG|nr:Alkaline ceramidase 3 [Rhizophlyctis rosea]
MQTFDFPTPSFANTTLPLLTSPLPFRGYEGYWGPVTSTLDWCEENYILTYYLAELWNSISNLCFLIWPLTGMYTCWRMRAEKRFYLSYAALMLVGTGSFLFHGTLTYAMQLLDELPMVAAICVGTYCHLQMFRTTSIPYLIPALAAAFIGICTSYLYLNNPLFFQVSFGLITFIQAASALRNVLTLQKTHPYQSTLLARLLLTGVGAMLLAFGLWTSDQVACTHLQQQRNMVGYPLRIVMELHAWWHLLTGFAGYVSVMGSQYGRALALGREDVRVGLLCGFLPVCVEDGQKWWLPMRIAGGKSVEGKVQEVEGRKRVSRKKSLVGADKKRA